MLKQDFVHVVVLAVILVLLIIGVSIVKADPLTNKIINDKIIKAGFVKQANNVYKREIDNGVIIEFLSFVKRGEKYQVKYTFYHSPTSWKMTLFEHPAFAEKDLETRIKKMIEQFRVAAKKMLDYLIKKELKGLKEASYAL